MRDRAGRLLYRSAATLIGIYRRVRRPTIHGVRCMIERDGRVLMVRHTYGPGGWTFPGGLLGRDEDPMEAARREVAEELGLEVSDLTYLGQVRVGPRKGPLQIVECYRGSTHREPEPRAIEIAEARWSPIDDLPEKTMEGTLAMVSLLRHRPGGDTSCADDSRADSPRVALDGDLTDSTAVLPVPLEVAGWAADPAGIRSVAIEIDETVIDAVLLPAGPRAPAPQGDEEENRVRFVCRLGRDVVADGLRRFKVIVTAHGGRQASWERRVEAKRWPSRLPSPVVSVSLTRDPAPAADPDRPLDPEREREIGAEAERVAAAWRAQEARLHEESALLIPIPRRARGSA